jgi:nitrite reductase/ring-hydroxylating ferredoxin subunit
MSNILPTGHELVSIADLPDNGTRQFDLGAGDWPLRGFVVRVGADIHAYVNRCPHAGRPLNFADRFLTPDGELIQCVAHGALFEKATGMCIAGPCVDEALRRIAVTVSGTAVLLAEELNLEQLERRW